MIGSLLLAGVIAVAPVEPVATDKSLELTAPVSLSELFLGLCAAEQALATKLPGEDVKVDDAPFQLKQYAELAISSRIVKIGERYAMRAQNPSRADPAHALLIRCAVTGRSLFADEVAKLAEKFSVAPSMSKTLQGFESASFRSGLRTYSVFAEADGSVSIFSLDIMMRNIPKKYVKKA